MYNCVLFMCRAGYCKELLYQLVINKNNVVTNIPFKAHTSCVKNYVMNVHTISDIIQVYRLNIF